MESLLFDPELDFVEFGSEGYLDVENGNINSENAKKLIRESILLDKWKNYVLYQLAKSSTVVSDILSVNTAHKEITEINEAKSVELEQLHEHSHKQVQSHNRILNKLGQIRNLQQSLFKLDSNLEDLLKDVIVNIEDREMVRCTKNTSSCEMQYLIETLCRAIENQSNTSMYSKKEKKDCNKAQVVNSVDVINDRLNSIWLENKNISNSLIDSLATESRFLCQINNTILSTKIESMDNVFDDPMIEKELRNLLPMFLDIENTSYELLFESLVSASNIHQAFSEANSTLLETLSPNSFSDIVSNSSGTEIAVNWSISTEGRSLCKEYFNCHMYEGKMPTMQNSAAQAEALVNSHAKLIGKIETAIKDHCPYDIDCQLPYGKLEIQIEKEQPKSQ